jgi:membrane protein YdbS with pleckstrin-like domain
MLWALVVILVVLWLAGFLVVHVGGGLIHLLLVIAAIVLIYQLVTGRRALEGPRRRVVDPRPGTLFSRAVAGGVGCRRIQFPGRRAGCSRPRT